MADATEIANAIAGYFSQGEKKKSDPEGDNCPHCGQPSPAPSKDESMSKKINRALGTGDDKSVF